MGTVSFRDKITDNNNFIGFDSAQDWKRQFHCENVFSSSSCFGLTLVGSSLRIRIHLNLLRSKAWELPNFTERRRSCPPPPPPPWTHFTKASNIWAYQIKNKNVTDAIEIRIVSFAHFLTLGGIDICKWGYIWWTVPKRQNCRWRQTELQKWNGVRRILEKKHGEDICNTVWMWFTFCDWFLTPFFVW